MDGGSDRRKSLASLHRSEARAMGVCTLPMGTVGLAIGGQAVLSASKVEDAINAFSSLKGGSVAGFGRRAQLRGARVRSAGPRRVNRLGSVPMV
jgi:hypothetical protein